MAHGAPDFARYRRDSVTFPTLDLAELAARLGSIVTYDRRGDVIFLDDFEENLAAWTTFTAGTGGAVALDTTHARSPGQSVKLTSGSTGGASASIYEYLPYREAGRFGLEAHFTVDNNLLKLLFRLVFFSGTERRYFLVEYRPAQTELRVQSSNGAYVTIADDVSLRTSAGLFHAAKLVVDAPENEYVRFLLDNTEYDLSGIASNETADTAQPYLDVFIGAEGIAGTNAVVYVDDVIVTQNEP